MKSSVENQVVIVSAVRTPIGRFKGSLIHVNAPQLGAVAIQHAINQINIDSDQITEVLMGCVLSAGL